jgi:hypothetical protein
MSTFGMLPLARQAARDSEPEPIVYRVFREKVRHDPYHQRGFACTLIVSYDDNGVPVECGKWMQHRSITRMNAHMVSAHGTDREALHQRVEPDQIAPSLLMERNSVVVGVTDSTLNVTLLVATLAPAPAHAMPAFPGQRTDESQEELSHPRRRLRREQPVTQ